MQSASAPDPYAGWIHMRTKNNGTNSCIVYTAAACSANVARMLVDGVEVTPAYNYQFGDSSVHTVYLLLNSDTSLANNLFFVSNYTISYLWIPASYTTVGNGTFRNLGASQVVNVLINSVPTSVGTTNTTGRTLGNTYVPDGHIDEVKALNMANNSKVYNLSDYTGTLW